VTWTGCDAAAPARDTTNARSVASNPSPRNPPAADLASLKGDPVAVAGLAASAQSDPFWVVRRGAIEALAKAGGAQGPAIMRKAARDGATRRRG
jgi:hypothetical protein